MRNRVRNVIAVTILTVLMAAFAGSIGSGLMTECKSVLATTVAATSAPADKRSGERDEDEKKDDNGKSGNFLTDLKQTFEDLNAKDAEMKTVTGTMELTMQCGFENIVKYGRNICIQSNITNNGSNFVGYVQVFIPSSDGREDDNVMYQKGISIPAGETKKIMFPLSPDAVGIRYSVRIVDEQGKEAAKRDLVPSFQYDNSKLFVGVLSDEKDYMGYLSQTDVKVFYLDKDKFPDMEESLDTLDVIFINNFNTGTLSKEQYEALKDWVEQGGTLVVGTGSTGSKTMDIFKDDFISGSFGDINADGVMSLKLDESKEIPSKKADRTFYRIDKGTGNVLVCSRDLGVDYSKWRTEGKNILKTVKDNLSTYKKAQINQESDQSYYDILDGLTSFDGFKVPSVGKYALILIIYILLAGPFLYLVLKKLDKRQLLWGLIPAMATVFGIGIYALGSDTRLDNPFVGYMNFYTMDGTGKDQGKENVFFSITVPTNDKYNFELPQSVKLSCLNSGYDMYNGTTATGFDAKKNKELDYKTAISYNATATKIELKDYSAFSNIYFKSSSAHKGEGSYEYDLKSYGYRLSGTFTNHLGYDLEHAMIVCDQRLVDIGDIKDGETVDLGKVKEDKIYNISSMDYIYDDNMINQLTGGDPWSEDADIAVIKRYAALNYTLNYKFSEMSKQSQLIAFTEEGSGDGFVQQMDLDCNGLRVVEIPLNVDKTSGKKEFISNIEQYGEIIEGDFDSAYRYSLSEEALMEVQFGEEDKVKSIGYGKELNTELSGKRGNGYKFEGKIYFYNVKTREYELVIQSGTATTITDMDKYLDENNKLLIKYKFKDGDGESVFPILSAVKEAK